MIIIKNRKDQKIEVGSLGSKRFKEGGFAYVGSGLNSLESRIERHLRDEKNKHWHIDYLLGETAVEDVIFDESGKRKECDIAKKLSNEFPSVQNFGCSDCKCESHLFYHEKVSKLKQETVQIFKKINLEPEMWKDG